MRQVFLVRHATTEAIEQGLMQGASESALSPGGQEEARLTAARLGAISFAAVFSSPMARASETAAILTRCHPGLRVTYLDNLREMNFGYYELKPYFASPDEAPRGLRRLILLAKVLFAQTTGESLRAVSRRAAMSWARMATIVPEGALLVVSHGVLLNYLLKYLLPPARFKSIQPVSLKPCSLTELTVSAPGSVEIIRINDTSHLR